jgi:uncharacterized protein DUF3786
MNQMKQSQKELFRWADQISEPLWTDLSNRSPREAAEMVGATWNGETFEVPMIGVDYTIDPTNKIIRKTSHVDKPVSYQAGVILLTALAKSKGVPPSGRMVVPQELPGGRMFFTGAHTLATGRIVKKFEKDSDQLIDRILGLGGKMINGADVAAQLPGLPYVPLYIYLWRGDQGEAARAAIGIDDRAHFHLDLAGVLALTNILVHKLCKN